MPTITRWFRVTHDINSDPEIWELRETYGDRAVLVWLEILSIADRNSGVLGPVSDHTRNQLAAKCRTPRSRVGSVLDWCRSRAWLVSEVPPTALGPASDTGRTSLGAKSDHYWRVAKWRKYNNTRDSAQSPSETTPRHDSPRQTKDINKAPVAPIALPDWIDKQTWSDYKQMRIRLRKPMTPRAEVLALQHLDNLRQQGQQPSAVVEQSIYNSWQALYPVKNDNGNGQKESELSEQTQKILRRGL